MKDKIKREVLGIEQKTLLELFEEKGYTPYSFAKTFYLSYNTVLDLTKSPYGIEKARFDTVRAISKGLGLDLETLALTVIPPTEKEDKDD